MDQAEPVLVLSDGSVPGLLACAAASGRGRRGSGGSARDSVASICIDGATHDYRTRAVERQADLFGLPFLHSIPDSPGAEGRTVEEARAVALLEAGFVARREGAGTVIWPISAGVEANLDAIAEAVDLALLAGRLVSVGSGPTVRFQTPYADLTDRQLADLVLDMDLPIWTCWWAGEPAPPAIAQRALQERAHWTRMLNEAGWSGALPGPELMPETKPTRAPSTPSARD